MTAATLPLQLLLLTVSGWVHRHQQDVIAYLVEENRVLKEQLGGRTLRLTDDQRRRLAAKAHGALKFGRETRTPAMQAGLATRRLTLRDIFVSLRSLVSSLSDVLTLANSRRMAAAAVMYMPVAA